MPASDISQKIKKATVAVVIYQPQNYPKRPFTIIGSGFCIHKDGLIVTCRHVMEAFMSPDSLKQVLQSIADDSNRVTEIEGAIPYVLFFHGVEGNEVVMHQASVVNAVSKNDFDLALLKVGPHKALKDGYPTLEIDDFSDIHEMLEVGTCGYPLGEVLHDQMSTVTSSFTRGMISSIGPAPGVSPEAIKVFQLDMTATFGNSGGPVFRWDNGRVIGVLQGGAVDPNNRLPVQGLTRAEPILPIMDNKLMQRLLVGIQLPTIGS